MPRTPRDSQPTTTELLFTVLVDGKVKVKDVPNDEAQRALNRALNLKGEHDIVLRWPHQYGTKEET